MDDKEKEDTTQEKVRPSNAFHRQLKQEFLETYILNRASSFPHKFDAEDEVKQAIMSWELIQKELFKKEDKDVSSD